MENFSKEGHQVQEQGSIRSLFPAAATIEAKTAGQGLFPSAKTITKSSNQTLAADTKSNDRSANTDSGNNLEDLRIDLAPSTFNAINAVQNIGRPAEHAPEISKNKQEEPRSRSPSLSSGEEIKTEVCEAQHSREKKSKHKHKHKHKSKKVKKRRHSESPPNLSSFESKRPHIPVTAIFYNDISGLKPEHAHHIDRKKNKDLWHYKSISSRHISKYKPFSRKILGAPGLNLNVNSDANKKADKTQTSYRYFGKTSARQIRRKGAAVSNSGKSTIVQGLDYIQIPKQTDASHESENSQNINTDVAIKQVDDDNFVMDEIFEQTRSYNQRTRDEPNNVTLWLDFVAFQDVVSRVEKGFEGSSLSQVGRQREVYRPPKSVIEKKLAILDKALESNPSSLELKMAQLDLSQDVLETEKVDQAWRDLLFVHNGNVDLWREYLVKRQHSLCQGGSTFSSTVKLFHRCFQTLVPIMDGKVQAVQKSDDMEGKIIGVFAQYCDFLHASGYTERAVATYQAMIEFNLYCPPNLNLTTTSERLEQFEEFWESSAARFGEEGACGWAKSVGGQVKRENITEDVDLEQEEDAILQEELPRHQTWLKIEKLRERSHFLPWRPDAFKGETEDSAEDLERLVMFDDVSSALFRLTKTESCVRVVCLYLEFLGFPSATLYNKLQLLEQGAERTSKFRQYSVSSMFQCVELSLYNLTEDLESRWAPGSVVLTLVDNILLQMESFFSASLRLFFSLLRLEMQVARLGVRSLSEVPPTSVKEIKKFGRNLLKESQNRNNLELWDAYIRLLWAGSEKMKETVSMLETALTMFMGAPGSSDKDGLYRLCLTYCQILLNFEPLEHIKKSPKRSAPGLDDKRQAIVCLGHLMEGKKFKPKSTAECTPSYILKVRNLFDKATSDCINQLHNGQTSKHDFGILVDCYALFEYCTSNLEAANSVYDSARQRLENLQQSPPMQTSKYASIVRGLFVSQHAFITNVMQISLTPISCMRKVVMGGLEVFPDCPELHVAFIELESGCHIAGRLRKYYDRAMSDASSLTVPLFGVVSELVRLHRVSTSGMIDVPGSSYQESGLIHRVRSVFESALSQKVSAHCPLIWRLYMRTEIKYGSQSRAKGILYRAIQSCPWTKSVYMDGVALFGEAELQEMLDVMTETELRVRIPLEEIDLLQTAEKEDDDDDAVKVEVKSEDDSS